MNRKITVQFTMITFIIVAVMTIPLIFLGRLGFAVQSADHAWMNIPFIVYVCSPAIASYIALKRNGKVSGLKEWLKNVFKFRNKLSHYAFVVFGIALFFAIQITFSGLTEMAPFFMFFIFLPIALIFGGMEESGWMYILQPELDKKYGFILSSIFVGFIWIVWHIPLFFIPGTGHYAGTIPFLIFAFTNIFGRFFYGAIHKISGSGVFLSILFHTMFNAGYSVFFFPWTWSGAIASYTAIFIISIIAVILHEKKKRRTE